MLDNAWKAVKKDVDAEMKKNNLISASTELRILIINVFTTSLSLPGKELSIIIMLP
jgi:hypothetical protein